MSCMINVIQGWILKLIRKFALLIKDLFFVSPTSDKSKFKFILIQAVGAEDVHCCFSVDSDK